MTVEEFSRISIGAFHIFSNCSNVATRDLMRDDPGIEYPRGRPPGSIVMDTATFRRSNGECLEQPSAERYGNDSDALVTTLCSPAGDDGG